MVDLELHQMPHHCNPENPNILLVRFLAGHTLGKVNGRPTRGCPMGRAGSESGGRGTRNGSRVSHSRSQGCAFDPRRNRQLAGPGMGFMVDGKGTNLAHLPGWSSFARRHNPEQVSVIG
jgi:hypothetical protein